MKKLVALLILVSLTVLAACGKKEAEKPVEKIVNITTATVLKKDLQVTESAVGSASALGYAQAVDPNRIQTGTYTFRLPFPEQVARKLRIGQSIRLTSFDRPDKVALAYVKQIRPALDNTTQSMEVIAELRGDREWYSIGSVRGEVVLGIHPGALVVPEQAVVLRPAGSVVYVVEGESVREQVVRQGMQRAGEIEILTGLKAGETVAVDGAALLSGGARIKVREAGAPTSGSEKKAP
jgi:membrane fusion protein (multidrug efflux system)